MLVLCERLGEAVEELLYRRRVDIGHDEWEGIFPARLYRREDVAEVEALAGETGRSLDPPPPDVAGALLLADAGLVLEEKADTHIF